MGKPNKTLFISITQIDKKNQPKPSHLKIILNNTFGITCHQNKTKQVINLQQLQSQINPFLDGYMTLALSELNSDQDVQRQVDSELKNAVYRLLCEYLDFYKHDVDDFIPWNSNPNVYYFPASRTGIMQTHKVIAKTAISNLSQSHKDTTLSGGITDFLEKLLEVTTERETNKEDQLIDEKESPNEIPRTMEIIEDPYPDESYEYDRHLDEIHNMRKGIDKAADDLEKNILKGKMEVEHNPVGYPDFIYKKDGLELSMLNASSTVTELGPIALFLKCHVKPGDTLIIEEPEAHLHPRSQKDIGDILVKLVKNGVNVIITTHNETLLQQISNYRMSESISKEKRKEIIGNELSLSKDELAIYNFIPQDGQRDNIIIKEIPFDHEHGISIDDHNKVSTELYDQTVDIQDEVESHQNKPKSA